MTEKNALLYVVSEDWYFLSHRLPMARAARDAGYDVHVATRVQSGAAAIRAEGFSLHEIPFARGKLSPFAALKTLLALRRIERMLNPAVVHHVGLQCCVLGGLAATGLKLAQVQALTGLGHVFTEESARTAPLRYIAQKILGFILGQRRSVALVQNPDDRAALVQLGIHDDKIVVIPGSGVDTERLVPLQEPDGAITIGFAGRLLEAKGIRELVTAQRLLQQQGNDILLLIAGDIDPANPASIKPDEVKAWRTQPGVICLGHVQDIVPLWQRSHIAVLPSHREGLPMTLLEASALGRPMIATDVPGCREIVIDGETGLLVPLQDSQALADAILKLANSRQLRTTFGENARKRVVEKMSANAIGASTVALYRSLH